MEPEPGVLDELKWNGDVFIKGFWFAATWHAAFMIILTCFCTFLCSKGILDFSFDTSMGIVAVGTVFPLVFSVQVCAYAPSSLFAWQHCPPRSTAVMLPLRRHTKKPIEITLHMHHMMHK